MVVENIINTANSYWQRINYSSRPHSIFKLDWSTYHSLDFADTFLPNADYIRGKALWMYDGAELFEDLKTAKSKQFNFGNGSHLFNMISYSYPKGADASEAKNLVEAGENEVCSFIEINEDHSIDISFKFGNNFKTIVAKHFKHQGINIDKAASKTFKSDAATFKSFFNRELVHYNMMLFVLNTIGITDITNLYKLQSSFAQQQLKQVAGEMGKLGFCIFMLTVFGEDIKKKALFKLFDDLENDKITPPEIVVTNEQLKGRKANYKRAERKIYVWDVFIDRALTNEETNAQLLVALVEEYGHHIDNLLRTDYSENKKQDTDNIDEGAKFALFFLTQTSLKLKEIKFGNAETPFYTGELSTQMSLVKQVANETYDTANLMDENPDEELEGFGSGLTPGTHGGIELKALSKIYSTEDIYSVYYGNWLRDYSQVIVGALVNLTGTANDLLEENKNKVEMPDSPYAVLTHDGWIEILEILAAKELVFDKITGGKKFCHQYKDYLQQFRNKYGQLTKDILGIYRPEEHIDNPKGQKDESMLPVSFEYEFEKGRTKTVYLYKGETAASLLVDENLNMKKYIHKDIDPLRPSSDTFIKQQIMLAAQYGKNKDGYRHLGAALHVIEDFFAHTNYAEIALIKTGQNNSNNPLLAPFKDVYPWVEGMQGKDYKQIPVVTGIFLTDDTVASLLPKIADKIFPIGFNEYEQRKPGDRTFGDAFILTLFGNLSKSYGDQKNWYGFTAAQWLAAYNGYLLLVDSKSRLIEFMGPFGKAFDWILQRMGEAFSTFNNLAFNILAGSADKDIREEQTLYSNKNYGTNPTHTQVAKDPLDHPLNELTGLLAGEAVKDIVLQVEEIWKTGNDASGQKLAEHILDTYTLHPSDSSWQDAVALQWVNKNYQFATRLQSPSIYEYTEKAVERTVNNSIIKKLIK